MDFSAFKIKKYGMLRVVQEPIQHLISRLSTFFFSMGPMLYFFSTSSRLTLVFLSTTLSEVAARHGFRTAFGAHNPTGITLPSPFPENPTKRQMQVHLFHSNLGSAYLSQ